MLIKEVNKLIKKKIKLILIIFVLLFPTFILVGCNVGPNISEYDEGNDLSFNSNDIKSLHIEMMLSQDDANIIIKSSEDKNIDVHGEDNFYENYNFRYIIKNKTLYIREAKLIDSKTRPSNACQTIEILIPSNKILDDLYFNSASANLTVEATTITKINTTANAGITKFTNVFSDIIKTKTWTGGINITNPQVNKMYLTTTYANINLSLDELPQYLKCSASSGYVNIALDDNITDFTVYPGKKSISLDFEYVHDTYEDGSEMKDKYVVGNGEKEIHYSGDNNKLLIFKKFE